MKKLFTIKWPTSEKEVGLLIGNQMKSVRNEWLLAKTDEDKLAWVNKWANLLMETWNNPIWVAGRANAISEVEAQMSAIHEGEELENPVISTYSNAMKLIRSNLRVLHGGLTVQSGTLQVTKT